MALIADNVRVPTTGRIYVAPKGTTAPVDVASAWTGWTDLGYLSDDGVEMAVKSSLDDIKAWQSLSPVRRVLTEFGITLQFTCMEFKKDVIGLYFPTATILTTGGVSTLSIPSSPASDERAFGLEWQDNANTHRLIIPRGEVTDRGAVKASRAGAASLQMTVSAYASSSPNIATWLSNDPAWT